jgi:hypothetical protein
MRLLPGPICYFAMVAASLAAGDRVAVPPLLPARPQRRRLRLRRLVYDRPRVRRQPPFPG